MLNIAEGIKSILEFYQVMGIDALPVRLQSNKNFVDKKSMRVYKTRDEKETALRELREEIADCKKCKLSIERKNIVFGEGNPVAGLMFIGEAPGKEEDNQGIPFVGEAGMLLTRLIEKMGLKRGDVYITNIVKCRPPLNRDPELDEIEACRGFVENQIDIISPRIIMALGRISASTLIGEPKIRIKEVRGKFFNYRGIPVMPTFHPAYLKRNPKDKWLTWNDAQKVLEKLKGNELQK